MWVSLAHLVSLAAIQRLCTFVLNQSLLSVTTPEVFGMANVEMELLTASLLFLAREGVRLTLTRMAASHYHTGPSDEDEHSGGGQGNAEEEKRQKRLLQRAVNLSWLPLPVCLLLTAASYRLFRRGDVAVEVWALFAVGALLECAAEPWFNAYRARMMSSVRFRAEALAMLVRSAVTFAAVGFAGMGLLGFAAGFAVHGATILAVYVGHSMLGIAFTTGQLLPRRSSQQSQSAGEGGGTGEWMQSMLLTTQSFFKHMLTEGDKIVLSWSATHFDQGVYALAHNYGSLAARLLFLPVEDVARVHFSTVQYSIRGAASASTSASASASDTMGSSSEEDKAHTARATRLRQSLVVLLKAMVYIGLIIAVYGRAASHLFLNLVVRGAWTATGDSTVETLRAFCLYVPLLAVNGISEAFVYATVPGKHVAHTYSALILSSVAFALAVGPCMQRAGTQGLVHANMVAMAARITVNAFLARRVLHSYRLSLPSLPSLLPGPVVLAWLAGSVWALGASEAAYRDNLVTGAGPLDTLLAAKLHVAACAVSGLSLLCLMYMSERAWLREVTLIVRQREDTKDD